SRFYRLFVSRVQREYSIFSQRFANSLSLGKDFGDDSGTDLFHHGGATCCSRNQYSLGWSRGRSDENSGKSTGLFRPVNRDASGTIKVLLSVDLPRALRTGICWKARCHTLLS